MTSEVEAVEGNKSRSLSDGFVVSAWTWMRVQLARRKARSYLSEAGEEAREKEISYRRTAAKTHERDACLPPP